MNLETNDNITIAWVNKSEIQKIDFAQCKEPKQTLEQFYDINKPDILINGGFFVLATGEPVMDYIDEGKVKASQNNLTYGIGITNEGELKFGKDSEEKWRDFISAYPPLLINGKFNTYNIAPELDYKARRTILGYNNDSIIVITIDSPGATFKMAAEIAEKAGCIYAINLDGGGSTRMLYKGTAYAKASYNRPVDNVIAIYTRPTPLYYRVQLGAFSSKANANFYCQLIKSLGKPYDGAYVRFVAPYYKVQVGAFSVLKNAESMVKDLKARGYDSFITTK